MEAVPSYQSPVRKELARAITVLESQIQHCGEISSTRLAFPVWSASDIPHGKSASAFCTCEWIEVAFFFTPGRVVMPVWRGTVGLVSPDSSKCLIPSESGSEQRYHVSGTHQHNRVMFDQNTRKDEDFIRSM